jgi:SecD/SecF fusion protein
LPGQKDIQRAKDVITQTAHLGFHMVAGQDQTVQVFRDIDARFQNGFVPFLERPTGPGAPYGVARENFEIVRDVVQKALAEPDLVPAELTIAFSPPPQAWEEGDYEIYLMDREERMTGEGLTAAYARPDDQRPGYWLVIFEFAGAAAAQFGTLTEQNIDREMAIVVDGNVMSAPTIQNRISTTGNITGNFTSEEAQDLAIVLNSGSLPVEVREEYAAIVGASIGEEAVNKGVYASIIGMILVVIVVIAWYRLAGVVAVLSLAFNALTILAAFAYFDVTLTLPGIAGLVLTIGMAVDSNVLIYERIREEQRLGKSIANCVQGGFENAASAILDSNITTLIAAAVLLQFGTGAVQGFAIALAIGIVTTVFAALIFSRAVMEFIAERQVVSRFSMTELISLEPKIDFMGKRRIAITASIIVTIAGVAVFAMRGDDNFGVDFRTGTNARIRVESPQPITDGTVREALVAAGFAAPTVQEFEMSDGGAPNSFLIRVGESEQLEGDPVSTRLQKALLPLSSDPASVELDQQVELLSVETVGPAVGAQLRLDAINAVLYALLFIIAYLAFRFEWKYALGAVVATGHDVLVVVGVMSVLGQQITIPVIAALLTIIGYSLNDTIVVFDRVREDLAHHRVRSLSFIESLNISINRTLSRTLLTSVTTMIVVVVMYFFGGEELKPFSLALILGIIVGTYSSIYVASPVVAAWQSWRDRRHGDKDDSDKTVKLKAKMA